MQKRSGEGILERFKQICRDHTLKVTPQRLEIFRQVIESRDHPCTDTIYRKVKHVFPTISFDTVHRTLLTFSRIGLLSVVEGHGDPRRYDPNLENHHHFRCLGCQRIIDIDSPEMEDLPVPDELEHKYKILSRRIVLQGLCDTCRRDSHEAII